MTRHERRKTVAQLGSYLVSRLLREAIFAKKDRAEIGMRTEGTQRFETKMICLVSRTLIPPPTTLDFHLTYDACTL